MKFWTLLLLSILLAWNTIIYDGWVQYVFGFLTTFVLCLCIAVAVIEHEKEMGRL